MTDEQIIERRWMKTELRLDEPEDEDMPPRIVGHGAVFNQMSEDLGGFREQIMPGAFERAIGQDDVRSLFNHNPDLILGRTGSGTLKLREDDRGLVYDVDPPETSYARDLQESIRRGDVSQSSFGFIALEESWRDPDEENPLPTRILHRVQLFDVGPVTFPAYPTTNVSARALIKAEKIRQARMPSHGRATGEAAKTNRTGGRLAVLRRRLELAERL